MGSATHRYTLLYIESNLKVMLSKWLSFCALEMNWAEEQTPKQYRIPRSYQMAYLKPIPHLTFTLPPVAIYARQ